MRLKDIINRNIAINCRTEEEAIELFGCIKYDFYDDYEYYSANQFYWHCFEKDTCYFLIYKKTPNEIVHKIGFNWGSKSAFDEQYYKIITLDDLEDFEPTKETIELVKDYIPISFSFNKTKKKLYLKYLGKEIRVKCDEKDKFEWKIGLGLALYRAYQKENDVKYMKKNYNYKKLAEYCLYKFYDFDENKIKDLEDRVNNSKENTLIRL